MVSMNEFAAIAMSFDGKDLPLKHIPGPEGVRGRNSDNTMIKEKLGWAPNVTIRDGLKVTYDWIKTQIQAEVDGGGDTANFNHSEVVQQVTDSLDTIGKTNERTTI